MVYIKTAYDGEDIFQALSFMSDQGGKKNKWSGWW
jgi:hypothetical protein